MKSIIVTGGCGYIGSQTIIEMLKSTDFNVVSIDNFSNSKVSALENIKAITGKSVTNYSVDLCDLSAVKKVFSEVKNIAGVIHFAALKSVPESVAEPVKYYKNNLESLLNLIQCSEEHKIGNFIFSSSCSVYGEVDELPVTEQTGLSEVLSPYAHTKLIGEQMIKFIAAKSSLSFIVLRYFNPVGADLSGMNGEQPSDRPNNLVPVITQTAAGIREKMMVFGNTYNTKDGSCVRDYIHVVDIAEAHVLSLNYLLQKKNNTNCLTYNLGSGSGITVLEAINSFEKVTGQKVNFEIVGRREGDVEAIYSDSSKARTELGWVPKLGIDAMMESAWKWQNYYLEKTQKV
jgi:UDP-glucose 4-epimerase